MFSIESKSFINSLNLVIIQLIPNSSDLIYNTFDIDQTYDPINNKETIYWRSSNHNE